jgi:hypothetical protein
MKKHTKNKLMLAAGLLSAVYLANMGVGIVEVIPDNIPIFGNIDEAVAAIIAYKGLVE